MVASRRATALWTIPILIVVCLLAFPAKAKYSGGTGEPNDPYRIATAADLIALGETPEDYDKHFLLTADIDLDPNLPGRKVFDRAVIAPDTDSESEGFQGTAFSGAFDGNGHTVSHLTVAGKDYAGLFGQIGWPRGVVKNVGVVDVNVTGSGYCVGGLVGDNSGTVTHCYSTGIVSGVASVGGLVGFNGGSVTDCYSTGAVSGSGGVGGLVGSNSGTVTNCYSAGAVSATGQDWRTIGGLVGWSDTWPGGVTACFWDTQTSGQAASAAGTGKTTGEMQAGSTFLIWATCGNEGIWTIDDGRDYPRLWWQNIRGEPISLASSLQDLVTGEGTEQSPYLIYTAGELNLIGLFPCDWGKHFKLMADIDLSAFDGKDGRPAFSIIGDCCPIYIPSGYELSYSLGLGGTPFTGVFDGNCHTISHLKVNVQSRFAGLFDGLGHGGQVRNLGVVDVNVTSSFFLPPDLEERDPYYEDPLWSYSCPAGGLVGYNEGGTLTNCYSTGAVRGIGSEAGGLVGFDIGGALTHCYSTATVSGAAWGSGGLVGFITSCGTVTRCYSAGAVSGTGNVGGLVGYTGEAVIASFWDTQTSGQARSCGGTGKTTAEMQTAKTFLDAGWDFVGEAADGTEDIWWIDEGKDYPHLWWEARN
jgi:hypothetical protein